MRAWGEGDTGTQDAGMETVRTIFPRDARLLFNSHKLNLSQDENRGRILQTLNWLFLERIREGVVSDKN